MLMTNIGARRKNHACFAAPLLSAVLLAGCAVHPTPLTSQQFTEAAQADRSAMFAQGEPITHPLTLSEAIARTLRDNLEKRSKMMEEAVALGQLDVDRFDLLPKVIAEGGYVGRSNHATVTSRDAITLEPALSDPYYSLDRDRKVGDLTVSWNVLDFGVSWFTAHQNADRALIASERRRKAAAALTQEVRLAYWQAAAAQELGDEVQHTITTAEAALDDARKVEHERLQNPLESLRFQKALLDNLRLLEVIQQELQTSKAELTALINVPFGTDYRLADISPRDMTIVPWQMPLETMEETAFIHNPDLREQVYEGRVAVIETRKTILKLLPGVNLAVSRQADSNSFLQQNYWNQATAEISMNLLNLISGPSQIRFAHTNEKLVDARRLALRMAVLAQVHVSRIQYDSAVQQFMRAQQSYDVERRLANTTASRQQSNQQSVLDRVSSETAAIVADLRRYQTFAQSQSALGRMEATIGVDVVPSAVSGQGLEDLSGSVKTRLAMLDRGTLPVSQP
jgi:outer membrane protein TolC